MATLLTNCHRELHHFFFFVFNFVLLRGGSLTSPVHCHKTGELKKKENSHTLDQNPIVMDGDAAIGQFLLSGCRRRSGHLAVQCPTRNSGKHFDITGPQTKLLCATNNKMAKYPSELVPNID